MTLMTSSLNFKNLIFRHSVPASPAVCWAAASSGCSHLSSSSSPGCGRTGESIWGSGPQGTPGPGVPGGSPSPWSGHRLCLGSRGPPASACSLCHPRPVCPEKSLHRSSDGWRDYDGGRDRGRKVGIDYGGGRDGGTEGWRDGWRNSVTFTTVTKPTCIWGPNAGPDGLICCT